MSCWTDSLFHTGRENRKLTVVYYYCRKGGVGSSPQSRTRVTKAPLNSGDWRLLEDLPVTLSETHHRTGTLLVLSTTPPVPSRLPQRTKQHRELPDRETAPTLPLSCLWNPVSWVETGGSQTLYPVSKVTDLTGSPFPTKLISMTGRNIFYVPVSVTCQLTLVLFTVRPLEGFREPDV